jgi:Protein of unknown function (DUF4235)
MAKILFLPFSIGSGLLAGLISKKTFELLWGRIDDHEPPKPEDRSAEFGKLALALAVEGALLRAVKGLVDHGARRGFTGLTGIWPGNEHGQTE